MPIAATLAVGIGLDPLTLAVPVTLAASCAFMMPVATPPNAIVFGAGRLTVLQMCYAGFLLNVVGTLDLAGAALYLLPLVFPPVDGSTAPVGRHGPQDPNGRFTTRANDRDVGLAVRRPHDDLVAGLQLAAHVAETDPAVGRRLDRGRDRSRRPCRPPASSSPGCSGGPTAGPPTRIPSRFRFTCPR